MSNDFINHLMSCKSCYGGIGRYCEGGKLLKIETDAILYAEALVKIPSKADREAYMAKFCPKYFDMPALKAAISEKYQAIKKLEKAA